MMKRKAGEKAAALAFAVAVAVSTAACEKRKNAAFRPMRRRDRRRLLLLFRRRRRLRRRLPLWLRRPPAATFHRRAAVSPMPSTASASRCGCAHRRPGSISRRPSRPSRRFERIFRRNPLYRNCAASTRFRFFSSAMKRDSRTKSAVRSPWIAAVASTPGATGTTSGVTAERPTPSRSKACRPCGRSRESMLSTPKAASGS